MFPSTTVASHALLLGAIVGCDASASKAKFVSKLRQVTHTPNTLKFMDNPRSEFLVVKHCGTQWARYVITAMPGDGLFQSARSDFIRGIDTAVDTEPARLLGYPASDVVPPQVRAECALPENCGGINIPTLHTIAPLAYVSSVASAGALLEAHSPPLHAHMLHTLIGGDSFRIRQAITQVREHHDWHHGSDKRGKPPFKLPTNDVVLLTGCCPRQSDLKRNLDSRARRIVLQAYDSRIALATGHALNDARQHKTRFLSASGKLAYAWLSIPPKAARFDMHTTAFPGHPFSIALRLRMGLPMSENCRGGTCRCRTTKAGTRRTERAEWDALGHHLCGQCG